MVAAAAATGDFLLHCWQKLLRKSGNPDSSSNVPI